MNILSLSKVAEKYRVCYNSNDGKKNLVHLPRGVMRRLQQCPRGLYYSDTIDAQTTVLVNTVEIFHTIVAKLLFLSKRARPNILTGVALITTRAREPDEELRRNSALLSSTYKA